MGYSLRNVNSPNWSEGDCQEGEPSNMRLSGRGDEEFVDESEGASALRAYWYGGP
jgi:hypothetical protein